LPRRRLKIILRNLARSIHTAALLTRSWCDNPILHRTTSIVSGSRMLHARLHLRRRLPTRVVLLVGARRATPRGLTGRRSPTRDLSRTTGTLGIAVIGNAAILNMTGTSRETISWRLTGW